jgi:hypothetical protein
MKGQQQVKAKVAERQQINGKPSMAFVQAFEHPPWFSFFGTGPVQQTANHWYAHDFVHRSMVRLSKYPVNVLMELGMKRARDSRLTTESLVKESPGIVCSRTGRQICKHNFTQGFTSTTFTKCPKTQGVGMGALQTKS